YATDEETTVEDTTYKDITDEDTMVLDIDESFFPKSKALGWKFEEIHVSLTYFGKKLTRLQLYTKVDIERAYSTWRRRHKSFVTASGGPRDGARIIGDGVRVADSEETLRIFSS
ncbi:hypothetical protein Tco_0021317, partial [Tanacetum coccineum]